MKVDFVFRHKNRWKHNQRFKTAVFHNKFTLCCNKPNIFILKNKFFSHKQYLFRLLISRNAKRLEQTKVYGVFSYSVWKETTHIPLKVVAAKILFSSVYVIATACFDGCFLFYMITRWLCFSRNFVVTLNCF